MNNQLVEQENSQDSFGESERSINRPPLRKQILNSFTQNMIHEIEQSYKAIGIDFFEEQVAQDTDRGSLKSYYLTQVFVKTWSDFKKALVLLLYDDFPKQRV